MDRAKTLVIKSNKLIGMQTQLSLVQMKIFALLISRTLNSPDTEYYRFTAKELMASCNMSDSNYTVLQQTTASMIKPVIFKGKDEREQEQYPLLDGVRYKQWIVDIALHRLVKPFILDVASKYTKYYFENISFLNSTYSIRLYEVLKEFEFRGARDFTIGDFRFLLNIKEWTYNRPYDLRTKIIEKAQKEIEEKTDISFTFSEQKEGRKVVWIKFKIQAKVKASKTVLLEEENSLEALLKTKLYLNNRQIKTVCKQFDEEYIKRNITYTLNQKNIKNLAGYFMKALELDYGQTLLLQQEEKAKHQEQANQKLQKEQKEKEVKAEQERVKKQQIQEFIDNREEEVKELIPNFIKANSFILQNTGLDLENTEELLAIIKGQRKEFNHIKSLFMGFIAKVVLGSQK